MSIYRLFSWGANSHSQLGLGNINEEELLIPKEVDLSSADLSPKDVAKIVGGAGHSLLLDKYGQVYSCGWNEKGQAGTSESFSIFRRIQNLQQWKIVDVACGWDSSMALAEDGRVFVWGSNSHGQLGLETVPVGGKIDKPMRLEIDAPVQNIAMGLRHSALVTRDARVLVSGVATKGQLGIDLRGARSSNAFLEVPDLRNVSNVACGQHHTVAVTINNEIFAWGDNKHSQLGINSILHKVVLTPMKVQNYENVNLSSKIYCGWTHSATLNSDKKVLSWGRNTYGQLGRAKTTPETEFWKAESPVISAKIEQLSVGSEHNVALTDDGTIISWGWNEHGNCGDGTTESIFVPTKVLLPEASGVLVGTGAGHSFAVVKMNC